MLMLRPTNRLREILAEYGYTLHHTSSEREWVRAYSADHPVVEADYRITENTPTDANPFHALHSCLDQSDYGDELTIEKIRRDGDPSTATEVDSSQDSLSSASAPLAPSEPSPAATPTSPAPNSDPPSSPTNPSGPSPDAPSSPTAPLTPSVPSPAATPNSPSAPHPDSPSSPSPTSPSVSSSDALWASPTERKVELDRVEILWVSPTEFVSTKRFDQIFYRGLDVYKMSVELKPGFSRWSSSPLVLYSYSIFRVDERGEIIVVGPPPVTPPRFLSHVLAPILDQVASIKLSSYRRATPPVDSALSLIPTIDHDLTQDVTICFSKPTSDLLAALVSYPFHPKVSLSFEMVPEDAAIITQIHDCLRDMKHLRRLQIPPCLLDFECSGVAFTANPAIQSLTIKTEEGHPYLDFRDRAHRPIQWSSTMLHGIVHNKKLKCLRLVATRRWNQTLEQLATVLTSRSNQSHAVSRLSTNYWLKQSNHLWDSVFSPALVVNWLKQQQQKATPPTGQWDHRLSGMAIRAINRGNVYRSATNLTPCDLTPSSASAIFHLVIAQHDESKNAGLPGTMSANGARAKRQKHEHIK
jgi:hypothetical protein